VPIALISGTGGQVIRPFALVIAAATLTSLLVSFTLAPLLASRYMRAHQNKSPLASFGAWWDTQLLRLERVYQDVLRATLRHPMRWVVIAIGFASLIGGLAILRTGRIGVDVFPSGDQSEVDITLTMPPATDISRTDELVQQLDARLRSYSEVQQVYAHSGGTTGAAALASGPSPDTAQITALLTPAGERTRTAAALAADMREQLGLEAPGARVRTALPNPFGFGGFGGQPIQVTVDGADPDTLDAIVQQITITLADIPGVIDVASSQQRVAPEYDVQVDPTRAADLGVSAQTAANALVTAVLGTKVSELTPPGQSNVDIRLIADQRFRSGTSNLADLPILSSQGALVTLGQIGTITRSSAPTQIAHDNRQRSVTVSASAAAGYSVGTLQSTIQQRLSNLQLPAGYSINFGGQAAQGAQTFGDVFKAMGAAVILMYMLMAVLFDSPTLPLSVLMSLPLAVIGAIGAMALTTTNFTLFSLLGLALLLGLVGKNAILLVDYTDTLRKRGANRLEALLEAGPIRLRPILMTTLSVIFALLPLAAGVEAGSELLKAAAVVLIGGLLTSTLLTLVFVPAMYTVFDDLQTRLGFGYKEVGR
jgi:hydrophobic/amphiphilic exporter-1 (mainly G- bacteria), HAE1 family